MEKFLPEVDEAQLDRAFAEMTDQKFDAVIVDGEAAIWHAVP
jgi:hypothetical protein